MKEKETKLRRKARLWMALLLMALLLGSLTVQAASEGASETGGTSESSSESSKKRSGLTKINGKYYYYKNGKKLKKTWKTVNGKRYYFGSSGAAATGSKSINGTVYVFHSQYAYLVKRSESKVVKNGNYSYCVDSKGRARTGWFKSTVKLLYADHLGRLKTSTTYDGIRFNSKGYAVSSTRTSVKIKAMSILSSITTDSMTNYQKLYACWNYVTGGHFAYWSSYPNLSHSDWVYECALNMLTYGGGNCYGFACAFCVLAKEIGYDSYVYTGRIEGTRDGAADGYTRHAWCCIGGCFYDPEAQYAQWNCGVYGYSENPYGVVTSVTHLT